METRPPDSQNRRRPPVPKPTWFSQSLKKRRTTSPSPLRSSGATGEGRSPPARMSIKQKIHSFENFSSPDGERGGQQETCAPLLPPPAVEKEARCASPGERAAGPPCRSSWRLVPPERVSPLKNRLPPEAWLQSVMMTRQNPAGSSHRSFGPAHRATLCFCPAHRATLCFCPAHRELDRGPQDGKPSGKILIFSTQVSRALMDSARLSSLAEVAGSSPGSELDPSPVGFSVSLASLRDSSRDLGSDPELQRPPTRPDAVLSIIPAEEMQSWIQDVEDLDEEALKTRGRLGFSIAGGCDLESKAPTVHRVFPSGLAAQEGTIRAGDQLLSINGQVLRDVTHATATAALRLARSPKLAVVVVYKMAKEVGGASGGEDAASAGEEQGALVSIELEKGAGGWTSLWRGGKAPSTETDRCWSTGSLKAGRRSRAGCGVETSF
ncbi:hypothetical protein OJAV_G00027570 [Oryzias javanicus]|uniref:PDZ domain-containing protein n=1 Tax=Oryzias javanicus TaxID=123683 RepID=A0A3S2MFW5_ORYJA|nr:hypothetical protein OJAV_G00027570 [Oryzias javanicus]